MHNSRADFVTLDDEELEQIDSICQEFDCSWRSATRLSIETFVAKVPARLRPAVLRELVHQEAELRFRAGEQPTAEEYNARFPDHAQVFERIWDALAESAPGIPSQNGGGQMLSLPREFGRYRVERELGRGGMGVVFLAHDTQLDRKAALKVLFFDLTEEATARNRFLHEARSMATLQHPNLCPIYDVGEIDGRQFLSMPYFSGKTLAARLRDDEPLSTCAVAELVRKVALAVHHAHQAGLVHRDLKPGNIMFDARGEPMIMDFGLARRARSGEETFTHSGLLIGSPAYMAPEQVEGNSQQIGPATDVWALGVILYQMLCGRRPFEGSTGSVLAKIVSSEPPPLSAHTPRVDPAIEAICLKALAKQPENRYTSARAMAEALDAYLRGAPADVHSAPSSTKSPRFRWAGVLLAASGILSLLGYFAWNSRTERTTVAAKEIESKEIKSVDKGWISLEPGPDLAGWKVLGDGKWTAQNGIIRYEGESQSRIMNDRVFGDFELSVEYFMPKGGKSGVFLRSPRDGTPEGSECLEIQLTDDDTAPHYASGTVFRLIAPALATAPQRIDDWNTLVVRVVGPKLTSSINGTLIADVDLFHGRWRRNVKGQDPRKEGHIGLQGSSGKAVEFRNLRIRPIAP
jgi:serine/threonine protein kinase